MKKFNSIEEYKSQPFAILYTADDIIQTKTGLATKDGKYITNSHNGFSYWQGNYCYADRAYGYFFITSAPDMLKDAAENLNKTLDEDYEFNPTGIQSNKS